MPVIRSAAAVEHDDRPARVRDDHPSGSGRRTASGGCPVALIRPCSTARRTSPSLIRPRGRRTPRVSRTGRVAVRPGRGVEADRGGGGEVEHSARPWIGTCTTASASARVSLGQAPRLVAEDPGGRAVEQRPRRRRRRGRGRPCPSAASTRSPAAAQRRHGVARPGRRRRPAGGRGCRPRRARTCRCTGRRTVVGEHAPRRRRRRRRARMTVPALPGSRTCASTATSRGPASQQLVERRGRAKRADRRPGPAG